MKISLLEDRVEKIEDKNFLSIIELIISAVKDYPLYNLDDTELYFDELKKILSSKRITPEAITDYLLQNPNKGSENNIWVISSLSSLLDAFSLMRLYKISFDDIKEKINALS